MSAIVFVVEGEPVPQARPRATRMGKGIRLYNTKAVSDYAKRVTAEAALVAPSLPLDDALTVKLDFYVSRPKSRRKAKHADRKPDIDNLCKLFLDSCEGVLFTNDSRIVELRLAKHLSDNPRTEVRIDVME